MVGPGGVASSLMIVSEIVSDLVDGHGTQLDILLEPGSSALSAKARPLYATERRRRVGHEPAVDGNCPGFQVRREAAGRAQAAGVRIGGQAEWRVVGSPERLIHAVHNDDWCHRTEDLPPQQLCARGH